jgi:hypothetical protein
MVRARRSRSDVAVSSPRGRARSWLAWPAVTVSSLAAVVVFAALRRDRFFFAGDKQNQYLPVARDIGGRLRDGEWLPIIDPDLGRSGNFALDLQYGLYEPTHWLVAIALSYMDNLDLAAALWSASYLALLAWGVCALLLRLGVGGSWAAATALGVSTSGFVLFWLAPSWIPGLVSFAWVPWWWYSAVAPRTRALGLISTGALAFLICGGGWPATWIVWGSVVAGHLLEAVLRRAEPGVLRAAVLHLLASAGGGLAALVTVLPLMRAVDFTSRQTGLKNSDFLVPNLADILGFASPELHGEMMGFGGEYIQKAPLFFGVWFVAVLAWFIPWRRSVLARPAFVTSLGGLALSLAFTQAPSSLGPLRWPVRMLPGVPLCLGMAAAVAMAALGLRSSRSRVVGACATVLAAILLAFFRDPDIARWLPSALVTAAATAAMLAALIRRPATAGTVALVSSVALAGWAVAANPDAGRGDRGTPSRLTPGTLALEQEPTLVLYPMSGATTWASQGVAPGFIRLSQVQRAQPGYSSIGQAGFDSRFCVQSAHGYTCPEAAARLEDREPSTGLPWADLLGYQEVVVHKGAYLSKWRSVTRSSDEWQRTGATKDFVRFSRRQPLQTVGRVTAVVGDASVEAVDVGRGSQTYDVDSQSGATLVFRDLYWPGYVATLDGRPLTVGSLDRTLVTVTLPPGSTGTLTVRYEPMPASLWAPLVGGGALLIALAALLARVRPQTLARIGRRRNASPGS